MSLKAVHVFFILAAISLSVFFGIWSLRHYQQNQSGSGVLLGILSLAVSVLLVVYLVWFLMKIRKAPTP